MAWWQRVDGRGELTAIERRSRAALWLAVVSLMTSCYPDELAKANEQPPTVTDVYIARWSVVDSDTGAKLAEGCGTVNDSIRFPPEVGQKVTVESLQEVQHVAVAKGAALPPDPADLCAMQGGRPSGYVRDPAEWIVPEPAAGCSSSRSAKVLSSSMIPPGAKPSAAEGYRVSLEVTSKGPYCGVCLENASKVCTIFDFE